MRESFGEEKGKEGKEKGKLLRKAFLKGRNFDERESFADMAGMDLFHFPQ